MDKNHSRRVAFGGGVISFSADQPALQKTLETHFAHCPAQPGPLLAHYHITTSDANHFAVSVAGSDVYPSLTSEQVLWNLMQDALTRLNGHCATGPVFHAAALENANGQGLILCGQSGSGKSSLAAWLVAQGFRYLTDEVIHYSAADGQIRGFARSLVLKRGSAFIWQRWLGEPDRDGFLRFSDGSAWIDPLLLNADGLAAQMEPRLLVFPHYNPQAAFRFEKLSPAGTLFRLLQCLVNARNFPDYGLAAATHLARQVTAFSLEYADIESATRWIKETCPQ